MFVRTYVCAPVLMCTVSSLYLQDEEYQDELAEVKDLAETRLTQIEELLKSLSELGQKLEMFELESKSIPEAVIKETAVYKSLQSNFSVAYAENLQLRTHLEEAKQLLVVVMSQHHTQVRMWVGSCEYVVTLSF